MLKLTNSSGDTFLFDNLTLAGFWLVLGWWWCLHFPGFVTRRPGPHLTALSYQLQLGPAGWCPPHSWNHGMDISQSLLLASKHQEQNLRFLQTKVFSTIPQLPRTSAASHSQLFIMDIKLDTATRKDHHLISKWRNG